MAKPISPISSMIPHITAYQDTQQSKLPLHVILQIVSHLNAKDNRAYRLVNKELNQYLSQEPVWTHLFRRYFPLQRRRDETKSFEEAYRNRNTLFSNIRNGVYSVQRIEREEWFSVESLAIGEGTLAIGDSGGKIEIWNLADQKRRYESEKGNFFTSYLGIAEQKLLVGFSNGVVKIYSLINGNCIESLETGKRVTSLNYALGKLIAGIHGKALKIFNLNDNTVITIHGDMTWFSSYVLADSKCFSCHAGGTIKGVNVETLEHTTVYQGHTNPISSLMVAEGRLISGDVGGMIKVWELSTGECIGTLNGHTDKVTALVIAEGMLISTSWDKSIKIWDLQSCVCTSTLKGRLNEVRGLAYADGKLYAGNRRAIEILDFTKGSHPQGESKFSSKGLQRVANRGDII